MTQPLIVGVNTAMFDGIDQETTFRIVHETGYSVIELAYNQGYVGNLDPALFGAGKRGEGQDAVREIPVAQRGRWAAPSIWRGRMRLALFTQRIHFAHSIGATYLNTCTARRRDYAQLVHNLRVLAPIAADHGCVICLENGGDPDYDAFAVAREGQQLLQDVGT